MRWKIGQAKQRFSEVIRRAAAEPQLIRLIPEGHCEIRPITTEIAATAGQIRGRLANRGVSRTQADMLIAATAQIERLTLVTRNVRDFAGCSIVLLDPFR